MAAAWVNCFPVEQKLLQGADKEGTLIIGIAGGHGHDVTESHN